MDSCTIPAPDSRLIPGDSFWSGRLRFQAVLAIGAGVIGALIVGGISAVIGGVIDRKGG